MFPARARAGARAGAPALAPNPARADARARAGLLPSPDVLERVFPAVECDDDAAELGCQLARAAYDRRVRAAAWARTPAARPYITYDTYLRGGKN